MGLISANFNIDYSRNRDMHITEMEERGIDEVLDIENKCFTSPWTRDAFKQELKLEWSKIFVAQKSIQDRKKIVGYICFWLIDREVHILNIAIHPNFRRREIAKSLIESSLEFSIREGAKLATLEVRKSNLPAISLYKKFSFEVKGIRPGYYSDNFEDAIIMSSKLRSEKDRFYL